MSEKTEIKASCTDQVLRITESPVVASGGLNEVRVVFAFCDKWKGFAKTAIFYRDIEDPYYAVLDENDTCTVPWEVYYEGGTFYFGVFGEKGDVRRTSTTVKYKPKNGAISIEMKPSDPTPEAYDQIMAMLAEARESQNAFVASAEGTLATAVTATGNANIATENANTATANANQATQNANDAASNANTEAGKATQATAEANEATDNANKATSDAKSATEATNTARETIQQTANEVLTSLRNAVFAPAIDCEASGEVVSVSNASNQLLRGLSIYGKTTQNGPTTPDAPAPMNHAGSGGSITVTLTGGSTEQRLTARTPNGLPGIPVASGGNYTDENGQAWACDEIDFARGVYVQRIAKYTCTGASDEYWADGSLKYDGQSLYVYRGGGNGTKKAGTDNVLCSHFSNSAAGTCRVTGAGNAIVYFYIPVGVASTIDQWRAYLAAQAEAGTPVAYIYELETPVETALSAQELAQFAALYSNKPNTTVTNDSGAGMKLSYVADTKNYIDTTTADISGISPEDVRQAVTDYLEENPVEAPVVSVNGKTGSVELTAEDVGALSSDSLQAAVNDALAQAKASGEFDGADGQDYVLTEADKTEIAELAAEMVEIPDMPSGGGSAQWRRIRTVVIPEDITADTSGVAFAESLDGGILFAFDTDESNQPFKLNEIYIYFEVGSYAQTGFEGALLSYVGLPIQPSSSLNIQMRVQGDVNGFSKGWVKYENCGGRGYHYANSQQSGFKSTYASNGFTYTTIGLGAFNGALCGFKPGSKFEFYGR